MAYHHHWIDNSPIDLPVGKAVCVGRNYAAHAKEMGHDAPKQPLLFMKPTDSFCRLDEPLQIPQGQGAVHHEIELVALIGETLTNVSAEAAHQGVFAYGLGLDLTLRDLQNQLKKAGHPWERAKAFDGAAPLSGFIAARGISTRQKMTLQLSVNNAVRQQSHTGLMLWPTFELISFISQHFTLHPGDVVFTGTPAGVGPLQAKDQLRLKLGNILNITTSVA